MKIIEVRLSCHCSFHSSCSVLRKSSVGVDPTDSGAGNPGVRQELCIGLRYTRWVESG